jgi:hypothetical protein
MKSAKLEGRTADDFKKPSEIRFSGDEVEIEQRTLTPLVLVRIQVPQPTVFTRYVNDLVGFLLPETYPFRVASVRDKFR